MKFRFVFLILCFLNSFSALASLEMKLFDAVRTGNYNQADRLLRDGVVADGYSAGGLTALFMTNDVEMAKLLLKYGAKLEHYRQNELVLIWAIRAENIPLIELYLDAGASPYTKDGQGQSALSFVMKKNLLNIGKVIVEKKSITTDHLNKEDFILFKKSQGFQSIIPTGPRTQAAIQEAATSFADFEGVGSVYYSYEFTRDKLDMARRLICALDSYESFESPKIKEQMMQSIDDVVMNKF